METKKNKRKHQGTISKKSIIRSTEEKKHIESKKSFNIWKIISICMVIIFVFFIIIGLFKASHYRSSITKPTQAQIDSAKAIATEKLMSIGEDPTKYNISVANKMRKIPIDGQSNNILQVSFFSNLKTHSYIIDLNNNEVMVHTQTDIYRAILDPNQNFCQKNSKECNNNFEFRSPFAYNPIFRKR